MKQSSNKPSSETTPSSAHTVAHVAVPAPLFRLFDYRIPSSLAGQLRPGCRVRINFGNRKLVAILIRTSQHSDFPLHKLKPVIELLDAAPCLPAENLALLDWAAAYYQHPVGEVFNTAITARLRAGHDNIASTERYWQSTAADKDVATLLKRAPKQQQVLQVLEQHSVMSQSQLDLKLNNWRSPMQALVDKQLARHFEQATVIEGNPEPKAGPTANAQQLDVIDNITAEGEQHAVHLLYGITGSGKTEVYIRLALACLERGEQVLLLVPEISLTPQLTDRFQQRLSQSVAVMHSALNDTERHNIWHAAASKRLSMLIGTRSAVFTPMPKLGLIIIDEEHDSSYKQQDGFRYNARDLSLVRAKLANIPVILGSATPSLESLYNVDQQRYRLHRLSRRAASEHTTRVALIDMRRQTILDGLSESLLGHIQRHLDDGNQVMLFINRRGFAPVLLCHDCGWTISCQRCDAHMTYHKARNRLRCHHCDSEMPVPQTCGDCNSTELIALGSGTERIESILQQRFPDHELCRIDRDTTRNKGALQQKLDAVNQGKTRILIGTQMLAKGHDFPDVTLVGILDTDQALYSADFRAAEHLAQLITQVSGRAGRASKPGEVLIQTHHPDHPLLQTLLHSGYEAFSRVALEERQAALLPPYSHMIILRCEAHQHETALDFMRQAVELFQHYASEEVSIFGPVAAPMEKRAGRYRSQIILQSARRKPLHRCTRSVIPQLGELKPARKVRWSVDVDPVDTY